MKFVASYSGGKDGALALQRMMEAGHEPVALVVAYNEKENRSWFHGNDLSLLEAISDCLAIPLLLCPSTPETYAVAFEEALVKAREQGATACVFGDIDVLENRAWNEARCLKAGIECILPLWQEDRLTLLKELFEKGFKTKIKVVHRTQVPSSYLGKDLTPSIIEAFQLLGIDPCGENGEYHTLVYDGPIFQKPLSIDIKEVHLFGDYAAIDIQRNELNHI